MGSSFTTVLVTAVVMLFIINALYFPFDLELAPPVIYIAVILIIIILLVTWLAGAGWEAGGIGIIFILSSLLVVGIALSE